MLGRMNVPRAAVALVLLLSLVSCGPSESDLRIGWPKEVVPDKQGDSGSLVIEGKANYAMNGGLEGNLPFVKAVDASGDTILEQHFQWPETRQALPPGSYTVNVYAMSCDANCGNLDPLQPEFRCEVPVEIQPGAESVVIVKYGASLRCAVRGIE